jgi:formylglycine-generating enzyme required for sulfatase activity
MISVYSIWAITFTSGAWTGSPRITTRFHHGESNGPLSGTRRVSRGGSWRHQVKGSRAAHRSSLPPEFRYAITAFVVRL